LLPFAAGLLAGFALPPQAWLPLLWLALVPLWGASPRAGFAWGAAAVLVSHRWLLALHPLDWLGVPSPLSLPLVWAVLAVCALAGGGLVALWGAMVQGLGPRRWTTAVLAALVWGLAEVLLARLPLFWLGLGVAPLPLDRPLAGLAALGGAGLVAAVQLFISWLLWRRAWAALLLLILAAHGLGWGALAAAGAGAVGAPPARGLRLQLVQPALPTRQKFEWAQQRRLLALLDQAQLEAGSDGAAAVVLPEGSLLLGQPLRQPAAVPILAGGFRREGLEERSSVLWIAKGAQEPSRWLDKHRLVPLGEWVPGAEWLNWSGLSAVGGLSPGLPSRHLGLPMGAVGVAICYELSDGTGLAQAVRDGAQWLLVVANLDPYPAQLQRQYLALAQLRAIETGRWLVSVANTGPSAVIDGQGLVRSQLPVGASLTAPLELELLQRLTPYDRWGEIPLAVLAGLLLLLRAWPRCRRGAAG
jgi:apolipoprotein N-acyltransferase